MMFATTPRALLPLVLHPTNRRLRRWPPGIHVAPNLLDDAFPFCYVLRALL